MKKISFMWNKSKHEGNITSIFDRKMYKTVTVDVQTVDGSPVKGLEINLMVSDVTVGQHGPFNILSIS